MKIWRTLLELWRTRNDHVRGGNVRDYPINGRSVQEQRIEEYRIMLYLQQQHQNTFLI